MSMDTCAEILSRIHITSDTEPEQNKSEPNNPEQDKAKKGKPKQDKSEQSKSEEDKPELHKLEQDKTKHDKSEKNKPEKDKPEDDKSGQDKAEQGKPKQDKSEKNKPEQDKSDGSKLEQDKPKHDESEQNKPEQDKAEQVNGFEGETTVASILSQASSPTLSTSTITTSSAVVKTTSKSAFDNSDQDKFGNFLTTLLVYKSLAQRKLRPTNKLQYEDYEGALAMIDDAIKLWPDNITLYGIRCHYYMKAGMYKEAIEDAQKAVAYDPNFTDGHICLAKCYVIIGHESDAVEALQKAHASCDGGADVCCTLDELQVLLDLRRDMQRACSQRDYLEAVVSADLFLEKCPTNLIKATKAQYLAMLGQTALALTVAEECLRDDSLEPEALYAKGLSFYYSDKLQQAVEYFQQVLGVCPLHLGATDSMQKADSLIRSSNEGEESLAAGRWQEALGYFKEALKIDDRNSKVTARLHCKNAAIYVKLNSIHKAIAEYTSALELDSNCVEALSGRAGCYADDENYERAIEEYEKILTTAENEATKRDARDAIATLAEKYKYQQKAILASSLILFPTTENLESALILAQDCLQFNPKDVRALCVTGSYFYNKNQFEKALDLYQQALIQRPADQVALQETDDTLRLINALEKGKEFFAAGNLHDALQSYDDALTFAKTSVTYKLYCKKAAIYLKLNDTNEAIAEYTNALSVDSECVEALKGRAECYTNVDKYEDAANDYEKLYLLDKSEAIKKLSCICHAKHFCKKATKCLESNKINEAIVEYTNALSVDSKCVEALRGRAKCYTDIDSYEGASNDYEKLYFIVGSVAAKKLSKKFKVKMYCNNAAVHIKSNELDRAIYEYSNALSADSKCVEALRGRAECYTDIDKYEDAAKDYDKLYLLDRSEAIKKLSLKCKAKQYCKKATKCMESNEINEAIAEYTNALSADSECEEALRGRAKCYTDIDKYEDAVKDYEKLYLLDRSEAIKNLSRKCKAKQYCKKAAKCIESNEINEAIVEYTNALSADSECEEALRGRAKCYTDIDKYEDAAKDYEKLYLLDRSEAIKNLSRKCKAKQYCKKAAKCMESNERNEAIAEYTNAVCTDSECEEALRGRAKCYTYVYRYEDAANDYEKLYLLDRSEATKKLSSKCYAKHYCNKAAKCLENKKYKYIRTFIDRSIYGNETIEAIVEYTNALSADSECVEALKGRAECYTDVDKYEDAAKDYEKLYLLDRSEAIKKLSSECYAKHYCEMAAKCLKSNEINEAIDKYTKALSANSECEEALKGRAECYTDVERYRDAANDYKKLYLLDRSEETKKLSSKCYAKHYCKMAAKCLESNHNIYGALYEYTNALSADRECVEALRGRAECYTYVDRYEDAANDYDKLYLLDRSEATKKLSCECKAKQYCNKATKCLELNRINEAIIEYTNTLSADSKYVEALRGRAKCYTYVDRYEDAANDYEKLYLLDRSEATKKLSSKCYAKHYCKKAAKCLESNEINEAIAEYTNALSADSECEEALQGRAECYTDVERYWDAANDYEKLYSIDGSGATKKLSRECYVKHYCKKAAKCLESNKINEAIAEYTNALSVDSECVEALKGRAECYTNVDKYEDAANDYEKLYLLDSSEAMKKLSRKCKAKQYCKKAEKCLESNDIFGALDEYMDALSADRECVEALRGCVKCYTDLDWYEYAANDYEKLYLLDSSEAIKKLSRKCYAEHYCEMAVKCLKSNEINEAIDKYTKALSADSECEEALQGRAECYTDVERYWDAANDYEKLYSIDGSGATKKLSRECYATHYCKKAAKCLESNEINEAIIEYTNALSADSECEEALKGRAECYTNVERYRDAANDYEKLYSIDGSEETKRLFYKCRSSYATNNYSIAQEKAEMGNTWYEAQNYKIALAMFEEAIRLCPDSAEYRVHAFSCCMKLLDMEGMLDKAKMEAKKAVELYVKSSKYFSGIAKCYIALGDLQGADRAILKARAAGDDSASERRKLESLQGLRDQAQQYMQQRDYESAVTCVEKCMRDSPFSVQFELMKAECLANQGQTDAALEIADKYIRSDHSDPEAHFVKGLCLYYTEKDDKALNYFKHVMRLYPDHKKASAEYKKTKSLGEKINRGNEAFRQGRWRDAVTLFGEALSVNPPHVKAATLHLNMAKALRHLRDPNRAVNECAAALKLHKERAALTPAQREQALSLRAECLAELGEHDAAVDDYERLYRDTPCSEYKERLDRAKRASAESSRNKDYYQILDVPRTANKSGIEKAYRRLSLIHHPDRHHDEFERKRHQRRFQDVQQAYNVLGDYTRRRSYDAAADRDCYRFF